MARYAQAFLLSKPQEAAWSRAASLGGGLFMSKIAWRSWAVLVAFSVLHAMITVSIYTALGIVLPLMVKDQGWSWTEAGFGFTVVGICIGGSSYLPAFLIRRAGVRITLLSGTGMVAAGLGCLSLTHGLLLYFLGAALCGVGYQMMALIPASHVLGTLFKRRGAALGLYFTLSALIASGGPFLVIGLLNLFHQDWRMVWLSQVAIAVVLGPACALLTGGSAWLARASEQMNDHIARERAKPKPAITRIHRTAEDWTLKGAMRTPQFWILVGAYFGHVLCLATTASFAVAHLGDRGVSTLMVGSVLTLEALMGVSWRFLAGVLGDIVNPKYILMFALGSLVVGMAALSMADGYLSLIVFAVGTGIGSTVSALAITILVLDYFGRRHNLEILSTICMSGAVSALGPTFGGLMRDHLGGFAETFMLFAALNAVVLAATIFMKPPHLRTATAGSASQSGDATDAPVPLLVKEVA